MNKQYNLCLNLLRLNGNPSETEIKRAYRALAKELHPDVNPSKNAQEKFQQITKAYQYLMAVKTGRVKLQPEPKEATAHSNTNKKYGTHSAWNSEVNQKAREAAREKAKKEFEEYVNSEEYELEVLFSRFFKYLALIIVSIILLLISRSILLSKPYALVGTITGLLLAFPMWWAYVRLEFKSLSFTEFKTLFSKVSQTHLFWTVSLGVTNVWLLFCFTLYTVLSTSFIILLFIALCTGSILVLKLVFNYSKRHTQYWSLGVLPFAINLLFLMNYTISSRSITETYQFRYTPFESNYQGSTDGLIFLPKNKFDDVFYLRTFYLNRPHNSGYVSYSVAKGLFGIDVIKDTQLHQFSPESR